MFMKLFVRPFSTASIFLLAGLFSSTMLAQASSKDAPAKGTAKVPSNLQTVPEVAIPQSVFTIPSQPSEGRNPFFPQSVVRVVVPTINPENPIDTSSFFLNGITSPPKRTAMINGRTFEPGEEGEVKLPTGGKMLIKCEEVKAESAVILIRGQRRELRLRSGL
jgi:hypothetical protein